MLTWDSIVLNLLGRGHASDWNRFDEEIKNLFLPQVLLLKGQQSNALHNSSRVTGKGLKRQSKKTSSKKSLGSSSEETTTKEDSDRDGAREGSNSELYGAPTGLRKSPSFEDSLKTLGGSSGDENSNAVSEDPTFPYPRYDSVDDFSAFEVMSRDVSTAPRAYPNTFQRMQELCEAQSVESESCWTEDIPVDKHFPPHLTSSPGSVATEQSNTLQRKVCFTENDIYRCPRDFKITCLSAAKQGLLHEAHIGKRNVIKNKDLCDSNSNGASSDRLSGIPSVIIIDWSAPSEVPNDEPLWRGFVPNVYNSVRDNNFHNSMKSTSSLPSQDSKNMVSRLRKSLNRRKQQKTLFGDNDSASVKKLLRFNFE